MLKFYDKYDIKLRGIDALSRKTYLSNLFLFPSKKDLLKKQRMYSQGELFFFFFFFPIRIDLSQKVIGVKERKTDVTKFVSLVKDGGKNLLKCLRLRIFRVNGLRENVSSGICGQ